MSLFQHKCVALNYMDLMSFIPSCFNLKTAPDFEHYQVFRFLQTYLGKDVYLANCYIVTSWIQNHNQWKFWLCPSSSPVCNAQILLACYYLLGFPSPWKKTTKITGSFWISPFTGQKSLFYGLFFWDCLGRLLILYLAFCSQPEEGKRGKKLH